MMLIGITSCIKDLDVTPIDKNTTTSATVFNNPDAYKQLLAKIYAGLAVTGRKGDGGYPDILGIDEGFSSYLRTLWVAQELSTDEAVNGWGDEGIKDFHSQNWTPANRFITAVYYRIFYEIALCNEFIRESADSKLSDRGITGTQAEDIRVFRAEARFIRAYAYWCAIDLFGNVPFVDENDKPGSFFPKQITRAKLFDYIESELLDIQNSLKEPKTNEYARVDKAAAWFLLARLYLNAEVYTGHPKYTECITYSKLVNSSGYSLAPLYQNNFVADNDQSPELIFLFAHDGQYTQTWGGLNFVIHAQVGGSMPAASFGVGGGWGGNRTTKAFVQKFSDITGATDKRALFYTSGQSLEITDIAEFTSGYAITKFKNLTSTGALPVHYHPDFVDTDYPIFRLADSYLMLAEAVLRGGTGATAGEALSLVNDLRTRAYGNTTGNIASNELTLDFIIDERARELYWEGIRRTDLIRFGKFSETSYVWPWKGGVATGISTSAIYNLYPIPAAEMGANPNLVQNNGY